MQQKTTRFELQVDGQSHGSVVVDGVDVSNRVSGVEYRAHIGEVPRLKLEMLPDTTISGEAIIEIAPDGLDGAPLGEVVATWLEQVDIEQIWAEATNHYGGASPTRTITNALAERARQELTGNVIDVP